MVTSGSNYFSESIKIVDGGMYIVDVDDAKENSDEAMRKSRDLLVRLIGEKAVVLMEDGYTVRIRSGIDDNFEYEFCFDEVGLHHACDIMGVKTRPLTWGLCIEATDEELNRYDKTYTLITMLKADEREFVRAANFTDAETIDEGQLR